MNTMKFKRFLASLLIAGQVLPAFASPLVQRTYNPDLIAAARAQVENGNFDTDKFSPVDPGQEGGVFLSASDVVFNTVPAGQTSLIQRLAIFNQTEALEIVDKVLIEGTGFTLLTSCSNVALSPVTGGCQIILTATPAIVGKVEGRAVFSLKSGKKLVAKLSAEAVQSRLVANPAGVSVKRYLGEESVVSTIEVSNKGSQFVVVGNLATTGSGASSLIGDTCSGITLEPNQFCSFQVQSGFQQVGTALTTVVIPDINQPAASMNYIVAAEAVSEEGLDCAPNCTTEENPLTEDSTGFQDKTKLLVTPPVTNLAAQLTGTAISPVSITLLNNGPEPYEVSYKPTGSPGLTVDQTCQKRRLAPNEQCQIQVSGVVSNVGVNNISIPIARTGSSEVLTATVNIEGMAGSLILPAVAFSPIQVGEDAAAQTATLTNQGNAPLSIGSIPLAAGRFLILSDGCSGATLAPSSSCSLSIDFVPDVSGEFTSFFSIPASNGAVNLVVSGSAFKDKLEGTPNLTFAPVAIGQTAPTQTAVFTNIATQPSLVEEAVISGSGFEIVSSTCTGATLNAGQSCSVNVSFTASTVGASSGALSIRADSKELAKTALTGSSPSPVISASPSNVDAGSIPFGQTVTGSFVVSNTGLNPATITGNPVVSVPGMSVTGCAPQTLQAGQSCTINYTFVAGNSPTVVGVVGFNLEGLLQPLSVFSFRAQPDANGVQITPSQHDFGKLVNGSASQTFTVSKFGEQSQAVTSVQLAQAPGQTAFSVSSDTCSGSSLDSGPCSITVQATVNGATAALQATLELAFSNETPKSVQLSAAEVVRTMSVKSVTPFEPVGSGAKVSGSAVFENVGDVSAAISSVSASTSDITLKTQNCTTTAIAVGQTCTVSFDIQTSSTDARPYSGDIVLTYLDNRGEPTTVSATASVEAIAPQLTLSAETIEYDPTIAGVAGSDSKTLTLTHEAASGLATAGLSAPIVPTGYSLSSTTCSTELARGASCNYVIRHTGITQAKRHEGNFVVRPTVGPQYIVVLKRDIIPALTSVSPGEINNQNVVSITITGSGFTTGVTYVVKGADDKTAQNVTVVNSTTLTASLPVAGQAVVGQYDLKVAFEGGADAVLPNALNYQAPVLGAEWDTVDINLLNTRIGHVVANSRGEYISCAKLQVSSSYRARIVRSLNQGASWEVMLDTTDLSCSKPVVNPNNPNNIVIVTSTSDLLGAGQNTARYTTDGGATWTSQLVFNAQSSSTYSYASENLLNFFNGRYVFGPIASVSGDFNRDYTYTSASGAGAWTQYVASGGRSFSPIGTYTLGGILHFVYNTFQTRSSVSTDVNPTLGQTVDNTAFASYPSWWVTDPVGMTPNNAVRLVDTPGAPHLFIGKGGSGLSRYEFVSFSLMLMDMSKTYSTGTTGKNFISSQNSLPGRPETLTMWVRDIAYVPSQQAAYLLLTNRSTNNSTLEAYVYKTTNGLDYTRVSPFPAPNSLKGSTNGLLGRLIVAPNGQVWISWNGKLSIAR